MGKARTFARRTFLIGSSAIAGGVAFGIYATRKPHKNPLLGSLADGEATFNPWVKISESGITLITPHADIGQGAISMQALLLAEEMDLSWGQFTTSYGEPAPAYYNTVLAGELAPFDSHDTSTTARLTRETLGAVAKLAGIQGTGGSSSVPDSFGKLRRAGAIARETLKLAAAQETGIPVTQLQTENGAVVLPDGTRRSYTSLARTAATIDPVTEVSLRDASTWRLIGQRQQRLDIVARSTGTEHYGIDIAMEGMRYAAVSVNPRQGAGIASIDSTRAQQSPGVSEVLAVTNGFAVIADNTWNAFKGVKAVDVTWSEDTPYPDDQEDHWQAVDDAFDDAFLDKEWRHDGDVPTALESGDAIEREYRAPYVAHQPLEPLNAVARVADGGVEIWCAHQLPRFVQQQVAKTVGCDADDVIFHNQNGGGSFGHRLEFNNVTLAAEIAAQLPGTPIKLTYTREEDFAQDFVRQIGMSRGRGVVRDGKIEVLDIDIATPSVSASQTERLGQPPAPGADPQIAAGAWNLPYAVAHFRMRAYRVPELAPVSSWRSVGASTAGFFADTFVDEMIHAAGADPMEERLRLVSRPESRAVLEAVAAMSNWGSPLAENRGRGVAFVDSFGVPVAEVIEVTQTPAGIRIDKVYVAADVGKIIDPENFDNQVKGGVVWGLGHAMNCEITFSDGLKQQSNFHQHSAMRIHQCPEIEVRGLELANKIRGIGEPPVPPAAPALGNAIFAATGTRLREMPFNKTIQFV
ncbi:MAG: molybdopterin cofactor-binding domain-containing protein [Pseudomonadota bacterium]